MTTLSTATQLVAQTPRKPGIRRFTLSVVAATMTISLLLAFSAALAGAPTKVILLALASVPAAALVFFAARRAATASVRWDLFSPWASFPVLYVAWFALGSLNLVEVPPSFSFGLFEPIPAYVMGYAALGLGAYLAGVSWGQKRAGRAEGRACQFYWRDDRFALVVAGLGLLMLGSYIYIVAGMGAIPSLSADAGEIRLRITRYGAAEAVMFTGAWTLIPALMLYAWRRHPRPLVKWGCYCGVAVSSVLLLSLGGRSYLFVPLLTTLVARHYGKKRFAAGRVVVVGLALFLSLSLLGYLRDIALYGQDYGEDRIGIPGSVLPFIYAYFYVRYPVATFRDITEIIPQKVPYQNGALTFGPLATLLPGHHEQSDMFFKDVLGNDFIGAGQPATLLGPLYADAGLPGIVAGLFLAGMLSSRVHAWMGSEPTPLRVLLYAWLMQTLLFSLFANLFPYITTLWMPAFWMVLDRFLRRPAANHGAVPVSA